MQKTITSTQRLLNYFHAPQRQHTHSAFRNHLLSALAVAAALLLFALPAETFAATNPIASYSFDEGAGSALQDRSGNGYHGTLVNGPTWSSGRNGSGLTFDGSNDYVTMGDVNAVDSLSALTVSAWVKFQTSGGGASEIHFVDKSHCSGFPGGGPWELGISFTQSHKAEMVIYPRNGTPSAYLFSGPSTTSIDDGNWHYIVGRYDGSAISIWVDGIQENSRSAPGLTLSNSGFKFELGGYCNSFAHHFRGTLDDVRVYDRALSSSEIQTDMVTPVGGSAPAPDTTPPTVSMTAPVNGSQVSGTVTVSANASDNVSVSGVRFLLNGATLGSEDTTAPYSVSWNTSGTPNGNYTLSAVARDAAGNESTAGAIAVTVNNSDTSAPSTPTGLRVTGVTNSTVGLAWNASSDNVGVTGYRIYRNGNSVGTVSGLSFTDTGLAQGTTYTYSVAAYDGTGNTSPVSSGVNATTTSTPPADTSPPSTPGGLRTTSVTTSSISLAWNASSDNVGVSGYRVYRNGNLVGSPTGTSYTDSGLAAATSYSYVVSAYDAAGNTSSGSAPFSASTSGGSGGSPSYSTNFDVDQYPLSEGGVWRRANNAWTSVQVVGGVAYGTNGVTGGYDDSYALLSGFGPNQTGEAVVYRDPSLPPGSAHEVEILLRASDDASNARGYECLFNAAGGFELVRWNGPMGSFTHMAFTESGYFGRDFRTGDRIKCTIVGNTITMYINDVLMARAVDSTFPTGQPGISFFVGHGKNNRAFGLTSATFTSN